MNTVTVSGADVSLFHVAMRQYGDATMWLTIAAANGTSDPMLSGVATLKVPARDATAADGVPPQ